MSELTFPWCISRLLSPDSFEFSFEHILNDVSQISHFCNNDLFVCATLGMLLVPTEHSVFLCDRVASLL